MKKSAIVLGVIVISMFIVSAKADAAIISFGDTSNYWPGWGNGTGDDSKDVIGSPDFTGGQANITGGMLSNLTFNRTAATTSYWWALSPGDLFIDIGGNQVWDYVVDLSDWNVAGKSNPDPAAGTYNIYSINMALNANSGYILSGSDNTGDWSGFLIRDGHPVAADVTGLAPFGSAYFSGWGDGLTTQYSFDFDSLNLGYSGQFTLGWQPNCANDVIYETLKYTAVPEPVTMSLMGLGLLGFGIAKKSRKSVKL